MAREVELCEYLPEVIKTNREFQHFAVVKRHK